MTRKFFFFLLFFAISFFTACNLADLTDNYPNIDQPRYAQLNRFGQNQAIDTIKVVSYNVEYSKKADIAANLLKTNEDLNDADIILLQEQDLSSVTKIADHLNYNYVYYPSAVHRKYRKDFGNAVLSKWPIVDDQKIILQGKKQEMLQRIAVGATIIVNNKKVMIFSIHQGVLLWSHERGQQLTKFINALPDSIDHFIIGGDFNTITRRNLRAVTSTFKKHKFDFATQDVGWTHVLWYLLKKKNILDQIYSRGLKVIDSGKVINTEASDHIPIWAKFKLK